MDASTESGVLEISKTVNKPGIYVEPNSGAELECRNHAKFGSAQADAAVRVGYVYDRPIPKAGEAAADKKAK